MAGFFSDTSGLDATADFGGTNNAAADFARSGRAPSDLFERLFGKKGSGITSQPLPPPGPTPAISSAPSLVGRVLKASAPPPPPQANDPDPSPFQMGREAPPQLPPAPPRMRQPMVDQPAPFEFTRGIPRFGVAPDMGPPPPAQISGNRFGGNEFGGNRFGGNTFGGNRFGGNEFGRSASPPLPAPDENLSALIAALTRSAPAPAVIGGNRFGGNEFGGQRFGGQQFGGQTFGGRGYFSGGNVQRFARGGYPELMGGMPMRQPFAGAGYVEPDGQGDGRSDHVQAVLSPGEFVQDAETVSLLGNGDNDAGARGFEAIRKEIRKHKGKALAQGKFSPNAQSPAKLAKIGVRAAGKGRS